MDITCAVKSEGISTLSPASCAQLKGPTWGFFSFPPKLVRIFSQKNFLKHSFILYSHLFNSLWVIYLHGTEELSKLKKAGTGSIS